MSEFGFNSLIYPVLLTGILNNPGNQSFSDLPSSHTYIDVQNFSDNKSGFYSTLLKDILASRHFTDYLDNNDNLYILLVNRHIRLKNYIINNGQYPKD